MYSTRNAKYPVYYYRGILDNNNVSFAGFCWKIVRTTSTGGVKLIYNGVLGSNGSCNNTGEASQIGISQFNPHPSPGSRLHINYVFDNGDNSTIKTVIDNWFFNNLKGFSNKLEDTEWCSDRSITQTSGTIWKYGAAGRNIDDSEITPSIACSDADKFTVDLEHGNGKLINPIGLLTADEVTLAGSGSRGYTSTSYLSSDQGFWILSPHFSNTYYSSGTSVNSDGQLVGTYVREILGVRPSISLSPDTLITEGTGSINNPYQITN